MFSKIVMLGMFPPPVGGAAKNSKLIFDTLRARGARVERVVTSIDQLSHSRDFRYHFKRALRNLIATRQLIDFGLKGFDTLYVVPDGGWGLIYTFFHIIVSKLFFKRIVFHHRTFQYINYRSLLMNMIVATCAPDAVHIFLSEFMAEKFQDRYRQVKFIVSSNAHFAGPTTVRVLDYSSPKYRIGHLSNLCSDKGFFLVADLFEVLAPKILSLHLVLAGPIVELGVLARISDLKVKFGDRIDYRGAVFGEEKNELYENLDVFVFPTRFAQEAQPNVVYEALSAGVLIISTDRGCIKEMLEPYNGIVVDANCDFVQQAAETLVRWGKTLAESRAGRSSRVAAFNRECERSSRQYDALLHLLLKPQH